MPDERVYSEQEVTQLISRAVEISEQSTARSYTPGVTESELRKIASEVGVSAEALDQAIRDSQGVKAKKRQFRLVEEYERVVDGEIDPDHFDLVIEGIKPMGNKGGPGVAQVGRSLTMNAWTGLNQSTINVSSRNGRTKLKVRSTAGMPFLMTVHPALMASLLMVGALTARGYGWLAALLSAALLITGGVLWVKVTKAAHHRAEGIADNLRERIASTLENQRANTATATDEEVQLRVGNP